MSRILVVEDEQHIADGLRFNLEAEGHEVDDRRRRRAGARVARSTSGARSTSSSSTSCCPGKDGFAVAAELRAAGQFVPILMLTARGRPKTCCTDSKPGADDYLPKPFELTILLARVNGLLRRRRWNEQAARRRTAPPPSDVYTFAGRTLDFDAHGGAGVDGKSYQLTQMECDLLRYLVQQRRARPCRASAILEDVWDLHERHRHARDRQLHRPAAALPRERIRRSRKHLLTVRGVGYKFIESEPSDRWPAAHPEQQERRLLRRAEVVVRHDQQRRACRSTIGPNAIPSKFSRRDNADDSRRLSVEKFSSSVLRASPATSSTANIWTVLAANCVVWIVQAGALHRQQQSSRSAPAVRRVRSRRRADRRRSSRPAASANQVAPLAAGAERAPDGSNSTSRPRAAAIERGDRHRPGSAAVRAPRSAWPLGVIARPSNPWLSRRPVCPRAI